MPSGLKRRGAILGSLCALSLQELGGASEDAGDAGVIRKDPGGHRFIASREKKCAIEENGTGRELRASCSQGIPLGPREGSGI